MFYTLITGASGGIGLAMAKVFASKGHSLILIARSGDKLQALKQELESKHSVQVQVLIKDIAKPSAAQEIFEETQKQGWQVDILINNAGFGTYGFFQKTDWAQEHQMLELNIVALTDLTKRFLKPMVEKKSGKILNVASSAAFQPGPLMAVYYASKAYVLHFTEAIANELKGTGVTASVLCPGPTASDFQSRANIDMQIPLFQTAGVMSAQQVAQAGYDGLMKGKTLMIPGLMNQWGSSGVRFVPRKFVTFVVRWLQDRKV